jgi:hypothetical protein
MQLPLSRWLCERGTIGLHQNRKRTVTGALREKSERHKLENSEPTLPHRTNDQRKGSAKAGINFISAVAHSPRITAFSPASSTSSAASSTENHSRLR